MADAQSLGKEVFTVAFKGYAREEVDAFMQNVVGRDKQLREEIEQAREERDRLRREMEGLQTIVNAAKSSGQKWEGRLAETKAESDRLRSELEAIKRERDSFQSLAEKLAAQATGSTYKAPEGTSAHEWRVRLIDIVTTMRSLALDAKDRTNDLVAKLDDLSRLANE